jgi:hypothetical protein
MEEEVVYRPPYNMSQEINNSDTVPTAQNPEILVQNQAENTIAAEQAPLTFGEQDETEIALNAHDSFGDYGKEKGQEETPPNGSVPAHPEPGTTHTPLTQTGSEDVNKQPEERQKHAKNSRKRGASHQADNNLTVKKPGNQSGENVESGKVVPPNPTLTSSCTDTETQTSEVDRLKEGARADLKQRGIKDADKAEIPDDIFVPQAERRVRLGLVVAELVRANALHAKPEQIKSHIEELSSSYERPADVVRWYYSDNQRMAEVEAVVIESNVAEYVMSKAKVTEKSVSFDELMGQQG